MKFNLAEQKVEAVLINYRRKRNTSSVRVGDHTITSKPVIKCLGIMFDVKTNSKRYLNYAMRKQKILAYR